MPKTAVWKVSGFVFLLLLMLVFSYAVPPEAHAYTYSDVTNYLANNPAPQDCTRYIEKNSAGTGYDIMQKCDDRRAKQGMVIGVGGTKVYSHDWLGRPVVGWASACDGVGVVYLTEAYLFSSYRYVATLCNGETVSYSYIPSFVCGWFCSHFTTGISASGCLLRIDNYWMNYCKPTVAVVVASFDPVAELSMPPVKNPFEAGSQTNNLSQCGLSTTNVANGNLTHDQALLSIADPKIPVDFRLWYNSKDSYKGVLGTGWTHNYNVKIKPNTDGTYTLMDDDGSRIKLIANNGYYTPSNSPYPALRKNSDGTFDMYSKDGMTSSFNASGSLTAIADRNGNRVSLVYDASGNLLSITTPSGRAAVFSSSGGRLVSATDASGNAYAFSYSGDDLTGVSMPTPVGTGSWSYTYDANSFMLSKTDPSGHVVTYKYDDQHREVEAADQQGAITMAYPAADAATTDRTTTFTRQDGGVWKYRYDTRVNMLTSTTDPQGNVTAYTYDSQRNMTSVTDSDGGVTSYTYDANGNMLTATDPLGNTAGYAYNNLNKVTSITNADGSVTAFTYDAAGNVLSSASASGAVTAYQYDAGGVITAITDYSGKITTFAYDAAGDAISITEPTGAVTAFVYDSAGRMISMTDAAGAVTSFAYNALGQITQVTDAAGKTTAYTYDAAGNKITETDANANATKYEYDYKGRVTKATDALGSVTAYDYGVASCSSCGGSRTGRLASLTDAVGNVTEYDYNAVGKVASETDAAGNVTTYAYNAKGSLVSRTDAEGNTINYAYDGAGRLVAKTYPDGASVKILYDAMGRIKRAENADMSYDFTYDAAGRLVGSTDAEGRPIEYAYDAGGRKISMKTFEGITTTYAYGADGRLSSINQSAYNVPDTDHPNVGAQVFAYSYDTLGRRTALSYPSGTTASYAYDNLGRLLTLAHKTKTGDTVASYAYTHDSVGNRLTKTETKLNNGEDKKQPASVQYGYGYDATYRLTTSTPTTTVTTTVKGKNKTPSPLAGEGWGEGAKSESFTYDGVGNRTSGPQSGTSYTYGTANELTAVTPSPLRGEGWGEGAISNAYDKNGNLTKKTETDDDNKTVVSSYTYDYENRLIKAVVQKGAETTTVSFKYDPFGRRLEKKVSSVSSPLGGEETGEGENKTYTYVYDREDILVEYLAKTEDNQIKTTATRFVHGPGIDAPLAIEQKGEVYYYHTDGLGSITAITDAKQKIVESYSYDSFGNFKRKGDKVKSRFTFTGREWDKELGLYYYRARYYDARVGRFISRDPIGFGGGDANLFSYVGQNPVNFVDPNGLSAATAVLTTFATDAAVVVIDISSLAFSATAAIVSDLINPAEAGKGSDIVPYPVPASPPDSCKRKGKWTCQSTCHETPYGGISGNQQIISSMGTGPTESTACQAAIKNCQAIAKPGTYTRHCQCPKCWRR